MNELLPYAYGGIVILLLILIFDIRQRKKFKKILNQSQDVEPLLMKKSTGKKLNDLQNLLQNTQAANAALYSKVNQKLEETLRAYNSGQMPLPEYANRLDMMITYIRKHTA